MLRKLGTRVQGRETGESNGFTNDRMDLNSDVIRAVLVLLQSMSRWREAHFRGHHCSGMSCIFQCSCNSIGCAPLSITALSPAVTMVGYKPYSLH